MVKNRAVRNFTLLVCTLLFLTACGGPLINIRMSSTANINLNRKGEPLTVVVRIYQLTDKNNFQLATFDDLWRDDKKVLSGSLVNRTDVILKPGTQTDLEFDRQDSARYVGVMAEFRVPDGQNWRDIYELPTSFISKRFSSNFSVRVVGNTVEVSD